ncbi:NAD-dependent epimerase/dehydratase family protein [Cohnella herbarum]|uniref:NAD-dependent epimerase/dehydratase family protein n=1 Tax=Cohnella herbarum TaxID=2728023 RepID=A0A7Z2VKV7_9BACL|nr:NAD-dependent epimerase/dehydratase family protein [Cohnella herbarum]QJD84645.1 NAD-dependent epimerase/dehydratase family protein [Cohnella herbarum]
MKKIMVTGALGQIGSELVEKLRDLYGSDRVIATDIKASPEGSSGPYEVLDVTNGLLMYDIANRYEADTIIHLAALLSATSEERPLQAWQLNIGGLMNALEVSRSLGCQLFTPSSIAAFGPTTTKEHTPQDTIQRPNSLYGVSKVSGELLCDYYYHKFGLDTRGLRFPGLISYVTPPGGGTTDYVVEMYIESVARGAYTSYLSPGTFMDMMYMPDALNAIVSLMEADGSKLKHRNAFNVSAMSIDPEMIAEAIRKHIPDFKVDYKPDPLRQAIADSWPDSIDSGASIEEWGFQVHYDLDKMTSEMLAHLAVKGNR